MPARIQLTLRFAHWPEGVLSLGVDLDFNNNFNASLSAFGYWAIENRRALRSNVRVRDVQIDNKYPLLQRTDDAFIALHHTAHVGALVLERGTPPFSPRSHSLRPSGEY